MAHPVLRVLVILLPLYRLVEPVHAPDLLTMLRVVLMAPVPARLKIVAQLPVPAVFRQIGPVQPLAVLHLQQTVGPMLVGLQLVTLHVQVTHNVPAVTIAPVQNVLPKNLMDNLVLPPINVPAETV